MEFPVSSNNESIERFLIVFALELFCIVHCNSRSFFFQFILLFWLLQIIKGNKPKWVNRSLENSTVNSKPLGAQHNKHNKETTLLLCFIVLFEFQDVILIQRFLHCYSRCCGKKELNRNETKKWRNSGLNKGEVLMIKLQVSATDHGQMARINSELFYWNSSALSTWGLSSVLLLYLLTVISLGTCYYKLAV